MNHVVALSGGKDSTAMGLRLHELHPEIDFKYVCTPTGNEPEAMFSHWRKIGELLGTPIIPIVGGTLKGKILEQKALPNVWQRWCTRMLKIEPYAAWLMQQGEVTSYVGIRADEPERESGDYSDIPGVIMRFPMREWGWRLSDVQAYLALRGVVIPARTDCEWCFFQRLGEWRDLWRDNPKSYKEAEEMEALIGHTFRSPNRDTWPADLAGLRSEFERGRPLRGENKDKTAELKCRVCKL
jgi:3'-phosphoadenosine 5'-phosphosulfate sulfotransferase (PAPS reductase)/FAD synthetase